MTTGQVWDWQWQREVLSVLRKPRLAMSMLSIGTLLSWLANKQVTAIMWLFLHFGLTDEEHTRALREQTGLFALLVFGFIWMDLHLLNLASEFLLMALRLCETLMTNDYRNLVKQTEATLRKKWKNMRDYFATEYSKRPVQRSGDGADNQQPVSKWQHFNQLLF